MSTHCILYAVTENPRFRVAEFATSFHERLFCLKFFAIAKFRGLGRSKILGTLETAVSFQQYMTVSAKFQNKHGREKKALQQFIIQCFLSTELKFVAGSLPGISEKYTKLIKHNYKLITSINHT